MKTKESKFYVSEIAVSETPIRLMYDRINDQVYIKQIDDDIVIEIGVDYLIAMSEALIAMSKEINK